MAGAVLALAVAVPVPTVTISAGATDSQPSGADSFAPNTVVITGGRGPFAKLWQKTDDGQGTWTSGGTGTTFAPSVSGVAHFGTSTANYTCSVTDQGTGRTVTSNVATYTFNRTN